MDSDLDQCLRLLIKTLSRGEHVGIRLTPEIEDNAKTAVLEAASRLSYSHRVAVVTGNEKVESCVKYEHTLGQRSKFQTICHSWI